MQLITGILIISRYRKQVINNNYKSTIGSGLSSDSFKSFYKKSVQNVARIMVETLQFNKSHSSKITYQNIQRLESICKENNGLLLMTSHYGNWELACINLPLHTSLPCYGVYKPLKNHLLDKELIDLRSRFGLNLVPMNAIARSIAKNHQDNTPAIYILIADQNPRSIQSVIWVNFLGKMSAFSNGLIKLKNRYQLPVAYMNITPGKQVFNYNITFEYPNPEENQKAIEWYSQKLETQIKKAPQFWLWSHKRWKRKYNPIET